MSRAFGDPISGMSLAMSTFIGLGTSMTTYAGQQPQTPQFERVSPELAKQIRAELQPHLGEYIDLTSVDFVVVLDDHFSGEYHGLVVDENTVGIRESLFSGGKVKMYSMAAHEVVHLVQMRTLGAAAFDARYAGEATRLGDSRYEVSGRSAAPFRSNQSQTLPRVGSRRSPTPECRI